mgnify:FL=1
MIIGCVITHGTRLVYWRGAGWAWEIGVNIPFIRWGLYFWVQPISKSVWPKGG